MLFTDCLLCIDCSFDLCFSIFLIWMESWAFLGKINSALMPVYIGLAVAYLLSPAGECGGA